MIASIKLKGLLRYLLKRARMRMESPKLRAVQKVIFGQQVELDIRDLEQRYLSEDCVREPENLLVYRALSRYGLANCFIDIGANCGHVAASVVNDYRRVILFEPNPKLAELLRLMFKDFDHVTVKECAVVGKESTGTIRLIVPEESSGLATLGTTHLSSEREDATGYDVRAATLESETADIDLRDAYIKVDVEGFEYEVIRSASDLFSQTRPIVGFEALSLDAARKCSSLFEDCKFYCARFDFLENGGALTKSAPGIIRSMIFGGNIVVVQTDLRSNIELENFSQIYAVPSEKADGFEEALQAFANELNAWDLSTLKTWSD